MFLYTNHIQLQDSIFLNYYRYIENDFMVSIFKGYNLLNFLIKYLINIIDLIF